MAGEKNILLGVTGGVAAYKSAELARLLQKEGFCVQAVLTEAAERLVSSRLFAALTRKPVFSDLWDPRFADAMGHISLGRWADAILVAPASADFLSKLACGAADDLLSTLCLARTCPLLVAPAMNQAMWGQAATQRNTRLLGCDGVLFAGPAAGPQACSEEGLGRMLEPEDIMAHVHALFFPKVLAGKKVLVSSGPTFEAIDAVRGITNRSTGKMGHALARAAWEAGARVFLVTGPVCLPSPWGMEEVVRVTSALEMRQVILERAREADVFISAAAVGDYTPKKTFSGKIPRGEGGVIWEFESTPDILAEVGTLTPRPYLVGFALEAEEEIFRGEEKRKRKNADLLVANRLQALGEEESEAVLLGAQAPAHIPLAPKLHVARQIVLAIGQAMAWRGTSP